MLKRLDNKNNLSYNKQKLSGIKDIFMIDIIVIDNLKLLRNMLCEALNNDKDFNVIADASDAKEALSLCERKKPDLVLMAAENNSNGISYGEIIKEQYPDIKVIIMTDIPDITLINKSKKSNIDSLVYKNINKESLNRIIRTTMQGYSTYPNIKDNAISQKNILTRLSDKELEILTSYSRLLDREQVAKAAEISQRTLNAHIASIYDKTGFDNLNKLVIHCISNGYLTPPI